MMKKNWYYILLVLLLIITAVLYYKKGGSGSISKELSAFAVEDTAAVDKIIMTDKGGRVLILSKKNKVWYGNDSVKVRRDIMGTLLETIKRVKVKSPVAKPMRANIMKQLATGAVQVAIYSDGSLVKKYFVGSPTMDGFGTFMLLDGADDPFITHIPGFEGYLTVRFNTNVLVWKDRELIRIAPQNIKIIKVEYPTNNASSFTLKVEGKDYVSLYNNAGDTATSKINAQFLRDYLLAYSDVQYENEVDLKKIKNLEELLIPSNLLANITVYDKEGQKYSLTLYKRFFDGQDFLVKSEDYDFDRDRCFVKLNNKGVYNGQYHVFNKLIVSYKDFFSAAIK